jgi:hypothetical protein
VATSPRPGLVRCPLDCPNLLVNSPTRSIFSAPNRSVCSGWSDLLCPQGPPAFGPSQSTPRSPRLLPAPCSASRPAPQTTGPGSQQSQRPAPGPRPQRPKCPSVNRHHCRGAPGFSCHFQGARSDLILYEIRPAPSHGQATFIARNVQTASFYDNQVHVR